MLRKIISGGQTGADRSALDVAIKFNIEHGGWVPMGRKTEDGTLPVKYQMDEMESYDYRERTRQNIIDSNGTLILSYGQLTGGSKLTQDFAKVVNRPNCYIDFLNAETFEAAIVIKSFILENRIQVLNVAGPRLSNFPGIYLDVKNTLETALYLLFLDTEEDKDFKKYLGLESLKPKSLKPDPLKEEFPGSVEEAVEILSNGLPLKTKTFIAKFKDEDIHMLYFVMLDYLRSSVGFDIENKALLSECRKMLEDDSATIEDGVMEILKQLKKSLESSHILRVVK